jgi:hypothetical protein
MAVERQATGTPSAAELRDYLGEMWKRLPAFALKSAGLPAEERGSYEWQAAAGRFWWVAREEAGLSRVEAAQALGCSVNKLRLFEFGFLSPRTFGRRRLRAYAERLDEPDLFDQFQNRFER